MLNIAWGTFLRHLPPALQDGLSVKTRGGTEVSIATILRIDHELFAFKGRLSGTQDTGRVFFIPYDQIDHLYYVKEVREEDFKSAFDSLLMPDPLAGTPFQETTTLQNSPSVRETPVVEEAVPAATRPAPVPLKSAVLERFRSRTGSSCNGTKPQPSQG